LIEVVDAAVEANGNFGDKKAFLDNTFIGLEGGGSGEVFAE